ncbi:protein LAZ1 [Physcomitrium patens]|uniref:Uncharacterized protein n=1 Tax=Physcomitrium patens TaxID=3218 RepID=A9U2W8_PHYPA|nr:protein LAZ1-like [Physcomitrium patens]XP_024391377.1 protein LAZ1-like [Physcomitrium patens]XP_024391378.1 protein LAZ1-like [Physcomitrium patens]XP_024391379.1 protein LAZ1-like [Physcomitrium patens]XP_024391380.1 protein LAZ1-like [Physcomitrium patens]XP_024391381.1 protein LAZ1-like [Physcomitrium patens]XP_024391382.1 protein LAZ1-like [Physcomitrium patens]XP_024391384.1 protein LAZ1-like [Physcomitrium patens]XP_024391385.1 protein LAZ1-like [Physcomitrium patens]XP_02439138|eukprot:XP_024391376.1 protein LAZ1-like [Physcomitrella patens]
MNLHEARAAVVAIGSEASIHGWAVLIAGVFVLFSLSLSSFLLFDHLSAYNDPEEQKWIIGIIFMVPVYGITAFISLWKPSLSLQSSILGNMYEAYALYSFGCYLIACLGGEDTVIRKLDRQGLMGPSTPLLEHSAGIRALVQHPAPLKWCMDPWELGRPFYNAAKFGIVQYMILKTACALVALLLDLVNLYGDGEFTWYNGYPYITVVLNFSQTWALYCLVQFYYVTHEELRDIKPLSKFVCFKSIVFATWWQGVLLAFIFSLPLANSWGNIQTSLQDFIICIEMAVAAVAHLYIFPATPYHDLEGGKDRSVKVLADYAAFDSPLDPEEVRESERPSMVKFFGVDVEKGGTSVKESVHDVLVVGGNHVVHDMKVTMSQAVEPVEKGFTRINETIQFWGGKLEEKKVRVTKDDTWVASQTTSYSEDVRGYDDPLLTGSVSDSGFWRARRSNYGSAESSGGENSDSGFGGFKTSGKRWTIRR